MRDTLRGTVFLSFPTGVDPRGKKAWIGAPLRRGTPVSPFFLWHERITSELIALWFRSPSRRVGKSLATKDIDLAEITHPWRGFELVE